MAVDVKSVLEFLRRNGLTEAESALRDDINEKNKLASFDFEKFLFPIPPPIRITASPRPSDSGGDGSNSKSSSEDEFVSLDSSTSGFCSSSEFVNPYGDNSSSDGQSQFGTARTYPEWSEFYLHNETEDEDEFVSPAFRESDFFILPENAQDKFITDNQFENTLGVYDKSSSQGSQTEASLDYLDKPFLLGNVEDEDEDDSKDYIGLDDKTNELDLKTGDQVNVTEEEVDVVHEVEDEYEVFNLRIIHWKNRTGFEENKDLPIVINSVIGGRYYITEYIGSAAFSKVVQAQDLHNGVDVCLKIIKNDKDFFDQSLDEIKLLKHVNKHDPADEHHILRLYDYFYHQEHLFIVCELLRANLYEFQKFNQESGGEPYFNLSRLQVITRQCLDALVFLHGLGIIHCDLKPENILIKSYKRCAVKIIDLGSSCFRSDNLCLYVQSRSYRAPEVILGLPYDEKIDLWSLGCILAELCSGEVLFPNEAVAMILARIVAVLGPIETEMLEKGQETHKYFTKEYDLYHLNEESNEIEYIITEESCLEEQLHVSDELFLDFVRSLLEINPLRRPTALEALNHPWLSSSSYN
ncbi:Protein kinase-like domain superfamily [Arabidopsis thaliana x Arabidopsis arenosa]|uniref:Protein kinase-like domain superfamily n=1 Tax=Arabidopsis thaliana x Arabidopsis arenosa TaxID=1240361 RepID=A0A8T2A8L5_9BRAS|nr:Protein kinase-like domain superfamily [Arabidopsis thaliana x Arabidopsis arenosa]KAG7569863.1 Protein kinase-like domain superfamily [Arabidopsis thaliana x Arabidopsis arenosa]